MSDEDDVKPLDQPIDIFHYVYLIFDTKWIILAASVSLGVMVMEYSRSLPEIYRGTTKVDIIEPGNPGGMAPENRAGAESADLIEASFMLSGTKENYSKVVMARMRSRKFTRYFMDKHNIYALIYPEQWDAENQRWHDDFELNKGDAFIAFGANYRSIAENPENGVVSISMKHTDPLLAADLANLYVSEFNDYMRNIALAEIRAKLFFLQEQLKSARYIQTEQMLYRLIEVEQAAATIAQGEEEYALRVLDPATRAYDRESPARKKMTIMATIAGGFLATIAIIALDIVRHIQLKLAFYGKERGRARLVDRRFSVRGFLLRCLFGLFNLIMRPFRKRSKGTSEEEES